MPEISIIMPSLNVAHYYAKCMESVLDQTFKNFEVLAVDAGSADGTLEMIEQFRTRDCRVRLLRSPKASYGFQMNLALKEAAGKYVCIVETDDYIEPDMLECLHKAVVETGADYAKGWGVKFYEIGGEEFQTDVITGTFVTQAKGEHILMEPCKTPRLFWTDYFLWTGLYKRELLGCIWFNETPGAAFQDIGALFRLMHTASRAVFIGKVIYHYRQDNALASTYNPKSLGFVRYEYDKLQDLLSTCNFAWKQAYYGKMLTHTLDRFYYMSAGEFWPTMEEHTDWLRGQIKKAIQDGYITESLSKEAGWPMQAVQRFLNGNHEIYAFYRQETMQQIAEFMKIVEVCRNNKVVIFGCGQRGQKLLACLKLLHLSASAFADNDMQKQGREVHGLPVLSAEQAMQDRGNPHFLIANMRHGADIQRQLTAGGVGSERCHITKPIGVSLQMLCQNLEREGTCGDCI